MIVKLRLLLDYSCWPVWMYDDSNDIIDTLLPSDLKQSHPELEALFNSLQDRYDALFLDTPREFSWIGFRSQEDEEQFKKDWFQAVALLKAAADGKYIVVDDVRLAFPEWFPENP